MNARKVTRASVRIFCLSALALGLVAGALAQDRDEGDSRAEYIRAHYSKFEYRIPMRDGVKLFTSVYIPNDRGGEHPILMLRTPYSVGPYGADRYKSSLGPSEPFEKDGYIFVFQDVRGKYMSEGTFDNMRPHIDNKKAKQFDESSDTYDTIEWLIHNIPNNNGKVGMWGISYPGFYSSAGMIDSHPALAAVSPQAPIADWYWDDMHHNGAFILPLAFNFFSTFGQARPEPTTERAERFEHGTPDGYQFFLDLGPLSNVNERHFEGEIEFWNDIVAHPNYDEFWQSRNILPHLKNVKAAVMVVGGLFDTEDLYGPLQTYRAVEEQNPGIENMLVMGPWPHGGWNRSSGDKLGDAEFGFKTAGWYQKEIEHGFFDHYLKDGKTPDLPEALVFETGANRWRRFDAWPPAGVVERSLYARAGGALSSEAPTDTDDAVASDPYISDPEKPVPYTMEITTRWARGFMAEDQRFAAWRPDVRVYRTEPLEEDLTLAGPITADLWVSTTGTASDFIVKVIDVNPDEMPGSDNSRRGRGSADRSEPNRGGQQTLVRAEVLRGRFRNSFEHPEPFVAGEVTHVEFDLNDVLHTFKRGHRLMIQVQSSWFPFVDRNPQTWVENIFEAEPADFVTVTNRVHRSVSHPSRIVFRVLE